jgi:hypothetical protein
MQIVITSYLHKTQIRFSYSLRVRQIYKKLNQDPYFLVLKTANQISTDTRNIKIIACPESNVRRA